MKKKAAVLIAAIVVLLSSCRGVPAVNREPTEASETIVTEAPRPTETEAMPTEATQPQPTQPPETVPMDLPEDTFVRIADYIPDLHVDLCYATEENFTGTRIYDFADAYLRFGTVKKLMIAAENLAVQGYGLVIWDAYRPVYAQERLWEICPDPTYVSRPGTGIQSHCRGIAVDVTLYELTTGELLEMPTGFDDFSPMADRDYSDCTTDAACNAAILEAAMSDSGFKPYRAEWWHFTDTDSYDVEYVFDPAELD